MKITVNQVAFATTTALAGATAGSLFMAVTATSKVALAAYTALGIAAAGGSIGSVTAWLDTSSTTVSNYFNNVKKQGGIAIAGAYTLLAQALATVAVKSVSRACGDLLYNAIMSLVNGDRRSQDQQPQRAH